MNYYIDCMWLIIWVMALVHSANIAIKLGIMCAWMMAPPGSNRNVGDDNTSIRALQLYITALLWGVIIIFYN